MKASKRYDLITTDPNMTEMSKRFIAEITNKSFAIAFLALKDCISQKDYCKKIGLNETRFSRVLAKLEKRSKDQVPQIAPATA